MAFKTKGRFLQPWTKKSLTHLVREWDNVERTQVIAEDLGMSVGRVRVMARRLRKKGFNLPYRKRGYLARLIASLAED